MQKIRPDMDIGKNIQAIRYKNNMTQDQVVAKLNLMGISITKSTYAKLETNRMNIKASELVALAKLFHTDINAFFSTKHIILKLDKSKDLPTYLACFYNSIILSV